MRPQDRDRIQTADSVRKAMIRSFVSQLSGCVPCDEVALRTTFLMHQQRAVSAHPPRPRKRR